MRLLGLTGGCGSCSHNLRQEGCLAMGTEPPWLQVKPPDPVRGLKGNFIKEPGRLCCFTRPPSPKCPQALLCPFPQGSAQISPHWEVFLHCLPTSSALFYSITFFPLTVGHLFTCLFPALPARTRLRRFSQLCSLLDQGPGCGRHAVHACQGSCQGGDV